MGCYVDPVEVGHGHLIHCRHDFIGRDARGERQAVQKRTKFTLVWNDDDVFSVMRESLAPKGPRANFIDLPVPVSALFPANGVETDGRHIGVSQRMPYSSDEGAVLSKFSVDLAHAEP